MPNVLEAIADSINTDMKKFSQLSHNIANVNTTGFKSIELAESEAKPGKLKESLIPTVNLQNGTIKKTERNLDFAVQGSGFFQIQSEDGSLYLTRNGSFKLDAEFNLLTHDGHSVMGDQGRIQLDSESFSVDNFGNITSDGKNINTFKLISPNSSQDLEYIGSSLYRLLENSELTEVENAQIRQGMLESSNVSSSAQMIELIQISRHVQSNQKALMAYDQMLNTGINTLGQR